MNREKYLAKTLSLAQRETYTRIKEDGKYIAKGSRISTCNILMQLGLIIPNPESGNVNEFVLKGKPLNIPFAKKMPLPKDVVKAITRESSGPKHKPIIWSQPSTPPTVYSNVSREQHVNRWLNEPVSGIAPKIILVKCLTKSQMEYIIAHHKNETASEMAVHLGKEKYEVLLFCQANAIEPAQKGKRIGYNQQKKTA